MLNHLSIRLQYFSELPIQIEYRLVVIQFFLGKIQCDFFLWFSAGIVWRGLSLRWRLRHYSGSIPGSVDPIIDIGIPHRFHNYEICTLLHGMPTWSLCPLVWRHRFCIRKYEVYRRLSVFLTIVPQALRAILLSTTTNLSGILPYAMLLPKIPALVLFVGTLPNDSLLDCPVDPFRHAIIWVLVTENPEDRYWGEHRRWPDEATPRTTL